MSLKVRSQRAKRSEPDSYPFTSSVNEWGPPGLPANRPFALTGPCCGRVQQAPHHIAKRQAKRRGRQSRAHIKGKSVEERENYRYMGDEVLLREEAFNQFGLLVGRRHGIFATV